MALFCRWKILFLLLFFPCVLFGRHKIYDYLGKDTVPFIPWFTGPLLAPTPVNMKPGHPSIQPSLAISNIYGRYNSNWELKKRTNQWSIIPFVTYEIGFTERIGMEIIASLVSKFRKGKSATHLRDTTILLGFQIANDIRGSWVPDIRLNFRETFPTGKYRNLHPDKFGIDVTGEGAFQTGFLLVTEKLIHLSSQFFSLRGSLAYLFPSNVHVLGFNTYGGGLGTEGRVRPGQILETYLSGQYTLNQRWVFAFDTFFRCQRKATFSGNVGIDRMGKEAFVGLPIRMQITFAPQIEYNFSSRLGISWGLWFSVIGKNSPAFASAFFSMVYIW